MTQTAHTPGPWKLIGNWIVSMDNGLYIDCYQPDHTLEQLDITEANARLIAAAPDMRAALSNERDGVIESIEYALQWIKAELKTIEARCDREGVTGAHKDCDMLNLKTAIANLERADCKARAAIARATQS